MKKIVFLDIDGTILDTNKQIPELTKKGINELKDKGITVAIATGRGPFMFKDIREELGIDTYVGFNGQFVAVKNKPIHVFSYELNQMEKLLAKAESRGHSLVFMSSEAMSPSVKYDPHIESSLNSIHFEHPDYIENFHRTNTISQMMIFCKPGEEDVYEEEFPELKFVRWHEYSLDVLPKDSSKAAGIERVINQMGILRANTYAFGDGLNDCEMLKMAGTGIAMGNAHPELKKIAKKLTSHVNNNGLYLGFKELGLI